MAKAKPAAEFREHAPGSPVDYVYSGVTTLHQERSEFQEIAVLEHPDVGRMLILDGVVQLTERDEFLYHEMLVHPALFTHPNPANVCIVGGGDGGSLREVLKHPSVRHVTVAEIDPRVIEASREYLPSLTSGLSDARAEVVCEDGATVLERQRSHYQVIIVDSTDPVGPAAKLFSDDFYAVAARALAPDGVIVTQCESLSFHAPFVAEVQRILEQRFPFVDCYAQPLTMYPGNWWAFLIASLSQDPRGRLRAGRVPTRRYSRDVHRNVFLPPSAMRRLRAGTLV